MDASAFEADVDDDVSFADLYDKLPGHVKEAIETILLLARGLAKAGFVVAALVCCAWAFVLLLAWICLFWLQTQLLLKLSALLRVCYEVPKESRRGDNDAGSSPGRQNPNECLKEGNIAESQYGSSSPTHHTSDELDMFEAFLNSPAAEQLMQTEHAAENRRREEGHPDAGTDDGMQQHTGIAKLEDVEEAEGARPEMEQQQPAGNGSEDKDHRDWQPSDSQRPHPYDELYDVSDSEFIENNREPQQSMVPKTTISTGPGPEVATKSSNKFAASQKDAKSRALAKKEEDAQKRAAEQTAWLERLKSGNFRSPKNRSSQRPSTSTSVAHVSQSITEPVPQLPRIRTSGFHFTPEQLEEAASFAAEATRGHSSRRSAVRSRGPPASQSLNQKPSVRKAVTETSAASQPAQPKQHLSAQSRQVSQAGRVNTNDASKPAPSAISRSGILPPHLRKKLATSDRSNGEEPSTDNNSPEKQNEAQIAITVSWPRVDSDEAFQQIQDGEDHASRDSKNSEAQNLQTVENEGNEIHVRNKQQVFSVDTTHSNSLEDVQQRHDPSLDVPSTSLPRLVSIDDLMKMDQRECSSRLAAVVGHGNEHTAIRDRLFEPTPPITKPAERSMSIECLKALNTASDQPADARIARAQRVISSLAPNASTHEAFPGEPKEKLAVDNANPLAAARMPLPTLNVVPNTPTDKGVSPRATTAAEPSSTISGCGVNPPMQLEGTNTSTSHSPELLPDRPEGTYLQHQGSPFSRNRINFKESREAIENQVSTMSAGESTQALSVQQRSKSSSESPQRKAALQKAVQALNKEAHQRRASLRTLRSSLDATAELTEPIDETKESSLNPRLTSSGYEHTDLLGLEFASSGNVISASSLQSRPRPRPSTLLRAEALAFFAPSQKSAGEDDHTPTQRNDALSRRFESSGDTSFHTSGFTGHITPSHPPWDASFATSYPSSAAYNPFWEQFNPSTHWEGHHGGEYAHSPGQFPQAFLSASMSSARPARPAMDLGSNAIPVNLLPEPQPDGRDAQNDAFPLLSGATNNSVGRQLPAPPSLTKVNGFSPSTFDQLLHISGPAIDPPTSEQPVSNLINTKENGMATHPCSEVLAQMSEPLSNLEVKAEEEAEVGSEIDQTGGKSHSLGIGSSGAGKESSSTTKRKRRTARAALRDAWREREEIRKRVAGTWTLDGARSLEYATETYNNKRSELANTMADNELLEEDAKAFPILSKTDLSAPRVWPSGTSDGSKKHKKVADEDALLTNRSHDAEKTAPITMMTDEMLEELKNTAIEARKNYENAHDYFHRPPPQGRAKLRDLRAQGEKRIELAARRYRKKIEAVEAAYPNGLPAWLAKELWTFDDEAIKKGRDEWML